MFYHPVNKKAIIAEYTASSQLPAEHDKAKWGSEQSMFSRFTLGMQLIDWAAVRHWMDIGCGTGVFFEVAEQAGRQFDELVGVDITANMLTQAASKSFRNRVRFIEADLEHLPADMGSFDLVTLIGVLQQCGLPPDRALRACTGPLRLGGQLFLTTKNLHWREFTEGRLQPEPNHSWFSPDEIIAAVEGAGLMVQRMDGFLPRENGQIVPIAESHSMFVLARRNR